MCTERSLIFWNRKSIDNICGGNTYGVEADNGTITSSTTKQKSMDTWWTCSDPRTLLSFSSLHFRNEDILKKKKTTICTFFCLFILHYPPKLLTVWLSWRGVTVFLGHIYWHSSILALWICSTWMALWWCEEESV